MKLPLLDIVPRMQRMISKPEGIPRITLLGVLCGLIEGASLAALLPAISSLASGEPVWGMGFAGWLILFALLAALSAAANYIQARQSYAVALDFLNSIHRKIGDQVARQPLGWFSRPIAGRLSRMVSNELLQAGEILAHMFGPLITRITAAIIVVIASWVWNPLLGLVLSLSAPAFVLITLLSTWLMQRGAALHEPQEINLANRIIEYAQCQGALRSCGRSDDFSPLADATKRTVRAKRQAQWIETLGMLCSGMITQSVVVALISLTGALAMAGTLTPVPALAFIGLSLRFTSTLTAITESAMSLESRRPLLDAIDEVLTAQPLPEPDIPAELPQPGTVTLDRVRFRYSNDTAPVLNNVSFHIPAGSMVALVGSSGSGKTTIARLISRFYDADAGSVLVGGAPVTRQTSAQLMGQLSMVFQDVYLFDDTLEANIAVGREDASQAEIREAARLAGVTEIADRLPDGWSSRVGEGGRALSGGERQRVAIARAILKRSLIVLFDEATSALDVENEVNVVAAINRLRQQATVLIIAHRLDTISAADQIISLGDEGQIEEQGTHEELLALDGTYARFWDRLHRAQGWQLTGSGKATQGA